MSYYHHRQQQGRRKQWIGVLLLLLVAATVAALFAYKLSLQQQRVALDPDTLCPLDGPAGYLAVVFDKTDSYNQVQQRYLQRWFQRLKQDLPTGTQVSLYVIDGSGQARLDPSLVVCNPDDGQHANALIENPALLQQRWRQRFEEPLDRAISAFMQPSSADNSPIFEMLQVVALSAFPAAAAAGNDSDANAVPKRIVLISDMIQHTPQWSHYRGQTDLKRLKASPYFTRVGTNLQGAEVEILYVRRDGSERLQNKRHALFWADYIAAIGGRVTLVERIDG